MKPNFEIELLPEAIEFLESLDHKAREKFIITSGNLKQK